MTDRPTAREPLWTDDIDWGLVNSVTDDALPSLIKGYLIAGVPTDRLERVLTRQMQQRWIKTVMRLKLSGHWPHGYVVGAIE